MQFYVIMLMKPMEANIMVFMARVAQSLESYLPHLKSLTIALNIQPKTTPAAVFQYLHSIAKALNHDSDIHCITCILRIDTNDGAKQFHYEGKEEVLMAVRKDLRRIVEGIKSDLSNALEAAWEEEPLSVARLLFWRTIEATIDQKDDPYESEEASLRMTLHFWDITEDDEEDEDEEDDRN